MELHQCLRWVESQSETPILVVLSALLRNFYWYSKYSTQCSTAAGLLICLLRSSARFSNGTYRT
eukprot:SAG25_NODE_34_length_20232_cov_4.725534_4_plen_64_part_00